MSLQADAKPESIYLPRPATLVESYPLTALERFFRFQLTDDQRLSYRPGQFFEVSVPGIGEAPISICSTPKDEPESSFELVIRKVGNVTRALHSLQVGARIGIRGPFGTSFPLDNGMRQRDLLFICGGIGLVPVRPAIDYVLEHREAYGRVTILLGTKTPSDRLFVDELLAWKQRRDITLLETVDVADRTWGGSVGVITTLIGRAPLNPGHTVAVICGPPIMYKFVLAELDDLGIGHDRIYLSLERNMKCGIGKCGHCQIDGLYACQDGPVFRYDDIAQLQEAI
jgi:sulfhydrogenase subunit gamma (sulfur reductase)